MKKILTSAIVLLMMLACSDYEHKIDNALDKLEDALEQFERKDKGFDHNNEDTYTPWLYACEEATSSYASITQEMQDNMTPAQKKRFKRLEIRFNTDEKKMNEGNQFFDSYNGKLEQEIGDIANGLDNEEFIPEPEYDYEEKLELN